MKNRKSALLAIAAVLVMLAAPVIAQDTGKRTPEAYKLAYVMTEQENGKTVNQRSFSLVVSEGNRSSIRVGDRVPIATGTFGAQDKSGKAEPSAVTTQFQYIDVGLNVDSQIRQRDSKLELTTKLEVSGVAGAQPGDQSVPPTPILRQSRQEVTTLVEIGKTLKLASIDDLGSKRTTIMEVTVTKISE